MTESTTPAALLPCPWCGIVPAPLEFSVECNGALCPAYGKRFTVRDWNDRRPVPSERGGAGTRGPQ